MNKLYIFCGIPFSGKTTIAKKLSKIKNFTRIDLDDIKFNIYGNNIADYQLKQKDWDKIYNEMYKEIKSMLKSGKTVIHDTGNFTKHERGLVKKLADNLGLDTKKVNLIQI